MELKSFSWEIFTILCQGALAGLIVVVVTEWLRHCREREMLRNYATLVWVEMVGHKASFDFIAARRQLPHDRPHALKTSDWEQLKIDLAIISSEDFKKLTTYYQSVQQLDSLFTNYHGSEWKVFSLPFEQTHHMSKQALGILDKYRSWQPPWLFRVLYGQPLHSPKGSPETLNNQNQK